MELIKKNVHMNHFISDKNIQITVDDDFLIPENNVDLDYMIASQGEVKVESVKVQNGKVLIRGKMIYRGIYGNHETGGKMTPVSGELPFDESINVDEMEDGDIIHLQTDIEDLNVESINSRKYNVRAILNFSIQAERFVDAQICTDVQWENKIERQKVSVEVAGLKMDKKDIFRVKEEIAILQNKPNIGSVLWNQMTLSGLEMRPKENQIAIAGMIHLFLMYQPQEETAPIQWMENQIPVKGMIDAQGCTEDMITDIHAELAQADVSVKADEDGEARILALDISVELNIRLYLEEEIHMLKDVYSTKSHLKPVCKPVEFLQLQIKNTSKCKVEDRVHIEEEKGKILQICNSSGTIKVDEMSIVEDGIEVEGILQMRMVYITDLDEMPLRSEVCQIPFTYLIETPPMEKNSHFHVQNCLESLQAVMNGENEVEVKCVITFETLVLKERKEEMIQEIIEEPLKNEELEKIPGIVGYLVRDGDSLWKIAKENYTTVDKIKEINEITGDEAKIGDKIILLKQAKEI